MKNNIPVLALALALISFVADSELASAKDYDRFYFFGDSLSDDGNLKSVTGPVAGPGTALPGVGVEDPEAYPSPQNPAVYGAGGVSNGPVWTRYIAPHHVLVGPVAPATANTTDSFNFAWAGAAADISNALAPVPDARMQVAQFANPFFVDPSTIHRAVGTVWLGGNDLLNQIEREDNFASGTSTINQIVPVFESLAFTAGSQDRINAAMGVAADAVAASVQTLVDQGIKTIVVNNMPALDRTPRFLIAEPHLQQAAREGTAALNDAIAFEVGAVRAAAPTDVQIIEIDIFGILNHLLDNPSAFGFTNSSDQCLETDACREGTPQQAAEYVFWDGIHPTTRTHELTAALVSDVLNIGAVRGTSVRLTADVARMMNVRSLAQVANRLSSRARINTSALNQQRFGQAAGQVDQRYMRQGADAGQLAVQHNAPSLFFAFDGGASQLDEIGYSDVSAAGSRGMAAGADISNYAFTAGLDGMVVPDVIAGMAFTYGWGNAEDDAGGEVDLSSTALSVYAGWQPAWFRASLGFGVQADSYDIDRVTGVGTGAKGETDGLSLTAFGAMGADLQAGLWHVMPQVRLDFSDLEIDAYSEDDLPALALSYSDQSISYLVGAVELSAMRDFVQQRFDGTFRKVGQLQFGVGYEADMKETDRRIIIENRSVTGAAPVVVDIDDRDRKAVTAHLAGAFSINEVTALSLGYRGSISTSDVKDDAHWFSVNLSFALGQISPRATNW